jgi:hypothetical protein
MTKVTPLLARLTLRPRRPVTTSSKTKALGALFSKLKIYFLLVERFHQEKSVTKAVFASSKAVKRRVVISCSKLRNPKPT